MERNIISNTFTRIEETILGGSNWATESMPVKDRIKFFRDTYEWPGLHSELATKMFIESDIRSAKEAGQPECVKIKEKRAREAGLIE